MYAAAFIPMSFGAGLSLFVLVSLWHALKRERRTACHSEQSL
jgi:hypothetical protein